MQIWQSLKWHFYFHHAKKKTGQTVFDLFRCIMVKTCLHILQKWIHSWILFSFSFALFCFFFLWRGPEDEVVNCRRGRPTSLFPSCLVRFEQLHKYLRCSSKFEIIKRDWSLQYYFVTLKRHSLQYQSFMCADRRWKKSYEIERNWNYTYRQNFYVTHRLCDKRRSSERTGCKDKEKNL